MAIGTGWVDGAWVDAGWVTGAWSQTAAVTDSYLDPTRDGTDFITTGVESIDGSIVEVYSDKIRGYDK